MGDSVDLDAFKDEVTNFFNGQCVVEKYLGEGAFSKIFLIRHIYLDDLRIMKIVKNPLTSGSMLESIFREVKIAAPLKHENIISIHDAGIIPLGDNKYVYFIMEYVPSGDLNQYLNSFISSDKLTPINWVLLLIKQILFGLNILHSSNPPIVHGDLKPSNLLLSFNSQDRVVVKLTDFGFSKEFSSPSSDIIFGTRPFMAPECFKKELYPATDIYAVGVIFYLFLTNHYPYDLNDFNVSEILEGKPWDVKPRPPSVFNSEVSHELDGIVMKCLSFDYSQRYRDAKDLFKNLEKCFEFYANVFADEYEFNNAIIKAFRLAKYENKHQEAIEILEEYDMDLLFEEAIENPPLSSQKTVCFKDIDEVSYRWGEKSSRY